MQRFVHFYLSQLRFMLPAAAHSMRSVDIARVALGVMAETDSPGLRIVPLDAIRKHAEPAPPPTAPPPTAPPSSSSSSGT